MYRHVLALRLANDAKNQAEADLAGLIDHYTACAEELTDVTDRLAAVETEFQGFREGVEGKSKGPLDVMREVDAGSRRVTCPRYIDEIREDGAPDAVIIAHRHGNDGCRCQGVGYWFE